MGYAFTLALSKFFFAGVPTGAYVHYPTISTDMLGSLDKENGQGLNAGTGKGRKGSMKRKYWHLFAWMYSWVGGNVDVVMTNSSWTQTHIRSLWGPNRGKWHKSSDVEVVFPPVAVKELEQAIEINTETEQKREKIILYIAQFRPEKNHALILRAFSSMLHPSDGGAPDDAVKGAKLVLIGSVRHSDDATRVYDLRLLAHELKIKEDVEFICDASWPEILDWLRKSWVGVNGMWNEHFGIGVVEYQAAGLVSVVNDSGGPKEDIVVEYDGGPTGAQVPSPPFINSFADSDPQAFMLRPSQTMPPASGKLFRYPLMRLLRYVTAPGRRRRGLRRKLSPPGGWSRCKSWWGYSEAGFRADDDTQIDQISCIAELLTLLLLTCTPMADLYLGPSHRSTIL